MAISDRYDPLEVEQKIYKIWLEEGHFKAENLSTRPPYSIVLPPPNVTGNLHLGHALDHSIQDALIRWKRMSGFNVLWMPGSDHAGIATQGIVEKMLNKEGLKRTEMGREKFLERVWEWKAKFGEQIVNQMKRLGNSCDWDRFVFTLDPSVSVAVNQVFVDLHKRGLVYRGEKLINWSPKLQSAISDLEVDHKEVNGNLWHIDYPLTAGGASLTVATTRPETMLGDLALAVHPNDSRYSDLIGKSVSLPLTTRQIPIVADDYVDKEFGSGVVKITPAHDFNDYEVGLRHELGLLNILTVDGKLNNNCGKYEGLSVVKARTTIVEDLEKLNLISKVEVHKHSVGHCSRSGCVVEPFVSKQWFVKAKELAVPAIRVVESGTIEFEPKSWTKTYLHWMNNIQDWCVSRQLWWGHRIPAWFCKGCDHITVLTGVPQTCESCNGTELEQEQDVLDTWFSSGLWPFSTLGWPTESESQKTFYPTDVLVTGSDIIFFWVARMIMMGLEFKGDVPFRKVYLHGMIRDSEGFKMSKSRPETSVDPLDVINEHGADALRFALLAQENAGKDLKFSQQRLEGYRNFMNKIWNAARFSLSVLEGDEFELNKTGEMAQPTLNDLSDADRWIVYRLKKTEENIEEAFNNLRFSDVANQIYHFIWSDFCDWYLEFIKPIVYGENQDEKKATQVVLLQTLKRALMLLHPICPFITEELYQKLPIKGLGSIMKAEYPTLSNDSAWLSMGDVDSAFDMEVIKEVVTAIRNIRGENRIKPGVKIKAIIDPKDDQGQKILSGNKSFIVSLANLSECEIGAPKSLVKCSVSPLQLEELKLDVVIPLEGLVDFQEEMARLNKLNDKLTKEAASLSQRLENEKFLKNAPEAVVKKGKLDLEKIYIHIKSCQESLLRLK